MKFIVDLTIRVEADSLEEAERNTLQLFRPGLAKERLNYLLKDDPIVTCVTPEKELKFTPYVEFKPEEPKFVTDLDEGD